MALLHRKEQNPYSCLVRGRCRGRVYNIPLRSHSGMPSEPCHTHVIVNSYKDKTPLDNDIVRISKFLSSNQSSSGMCSLSGAKTGM